MALWRYGGNGAPDSGFGGGGKASYQGGEFNALAFDSGVKDPGGWGQFDRLLR